MNKLALILLAGLAVPVRAAQPATLATINGTPIKRAAAMDRAWKQFGTQIVNEMADEILIRQAAEAAKVKADPAEIDGRLKRIRDQFPDEKTFIERLNASPLQKLICTNSIDQTEHMKHCGKIETLDIAPLFAEAVERIHNEKSVSSLFEY